MPELTMELDQTPLRLADLKERGWTQDLARLHGVVHNHWYRLGQIEQAEASEAWRRDKEHAQTGVKVAFTRNELVERGWPAPLIREYLGAPASTHDISSGHERLIHIWRGQDVTRVEADEAFQERRALFWERSDAKKETLADRALQADEAAEMAAASLQVEIPFDDIDNLEEAARLHRNSRNDPFDSVAHLYEVPQSTIDRWVRSYVRHECTDYNNELERLRDEFPTVRDTLPDTLTRYATRYTEELIDEALANLS